MPTGTPRGVGCHGLDRPLRFPWLQAHLRWKRLPAGQRMAVTSDPSDTAIELPRGILEMVDATWVH